MAARARATERREVWRARPNRNPDPHPHPHPQPSPSPSPSPSPLITHHSILSLTFTLASPEPNPTVALALTSPNHLLTTVTRCGARHSASWDWAARSWRGCSTRPRRRAAGPALCIAARGAPQIRVVPRSWSTTRPRTQAFFSRQRQSAVLLFSSSIHGAFS